MKSLSYGFIFLLSAILTVVSDGGGPESASNTNSKIAGELHISNSMKLSTAFIIVSF